MFVFIFFILLLLVFIYYYYFIIFSFTILYISLFVSNGSHWTFFVLFLVAVLSMICKLSDVPILAYSKITNKRYTARSTQTCIFWLHLTFCSFRFGGQMTSSESLVLVCVQQESAGEKTKITVNCEKMIVASMLFKQLETALSKGA